MSEKKDQLKEILKDQLNREAKQIEEEVGLNDHEEIPNELKIRMKNALDQKIREREKRSEDTKRTDAYAELSEEDREALRLGREMLKNQSEEKKIYTIRRKKRNIRRIVALAAVLILVMAVPSLGNSFISMIKNTAIGFTIGVVDILAQAKILAASSLNFFEAYISVGVVYWVVLVVIDRLLRYMESKICKYL